MKRFDLLTIFPDIFTPLLHSKIMQRSVEQQRFKINVWDLRDYTNDPHRRVDDVPYGGGAGMVMKAEPLVAAIEAIQNQQQPCRRVYLTPKGQPWDQQQAQRLLQYEQIILLCGRYEGIDQRVIDGWIDEEISIGPYILAGGELPAMVLVESMLRLIPGVLGNAASLNAETNPEQPQYPQYTRPRDFRGAPVPEVLLQGDHAAIESWRQQAARTIKIKKSI